MGGNEYKNSAIDSVRQLDSWQPTGLPTERLRLDLSSITNVSPYKKKVCVVSHSKRSSKASSSSRSNETKKTYLQQKSVKDLQQRVVDMVHTKSKNVAKVFRHFDKNCDGTIDHSEFRECLENFGFSNEDITQLIRVVDRDNSNSIDYNEFVNGFLVSEDQTGLSNLNLEAERPCGIKMFHSTVDQTMNDPVIEEKAVNKLHEAMIERIHAKHKKMQYAFRKYDLDNSGTIEHSEFRALADSYGFTGNEVEQLLQHIDKDNKGYIQYKEFCKNMSLNSDHQGLRGMRQAPAARGLVASEHQMTSPGRLLPLELRHSESLNPMDRKLLAVQEKIIHKAAQSSTREFRSVQQLFRQCDPDHLGFVRRTTFTKKLAQKFSLTTTEATLLCNTMDTSGHDDIHIDQVMRLVDRVDKHIEPLETHVGGRKRYDKTQDKSRPDSWQDPPMNDPCLHDLRPRVVYGKLADAEREKYKDAQKMLRVLEDHGSKLKVAFNTQSESDKKNRYTSTKQSTTAIAQVFRAKGLDISTPRLEAVVSSGKDLTYSQLSRETKHLVEKVEGIEELSESNRRLRHCGTHYGARSSSPVKKHPAAKAHVSEPHFLHHDMKARDVYPAYRSFDSGLDRQVAGLASNAFEIRRVRQYDTKKPTSRVDHTNPLHDASKSRWSEKTMDALPQLGLGGNRKRMSRDVPNRETNMGSLLASTTYAYRAQTYQTMILAASKSSPNLFPRPPPFAVQE